MRLPLLLVVIVQLLLRGAAVPHTHGGDSDATCHATRPHVHLGASANHAARNLDRHRQGLRSGTGHHHPQDHVAGERLSAASQDDGPSPGRDDDAVYLDDGLVLTPGERASPMGMVTGSPASSAGVADIAPPLLRPRPCRLRPPGHGGTTILSLRPHVLRV